MESRKLKNPDSFRQLATLLGVVAEQYSHVSLDELTLQRWSDVMALMREVDDMVDEQAVSHEDILTRLDAFDEFAGRYVSLTPDDQNKIAHARLRQTAESILHTNNRLASTTTIDEYMLHRTSEAHATAQLFDSSASDHVREQPQMKEHFTPLIRRVGEAACYLDSAKDLPKDYATGRTQVPPTPAHRAHLLRASFERAPVILPLLRYPKFQKQLGHAAFIHAARRL